MIRVYRYGLLPPIENAEMVRDQMRLAHHYRNTLTEIERGRRSALRACHSTVGDIHALEKARDEAEAEHRAALDVVLRSKARTRSFSATPEMKATEKAARKRRSETRKALSVALRALKKVPHVVEAQSQINDLGNSLKKSARAHCGLGDRGPYFGAWGTYLLVEASTEQAAKKTPLYLFSKPKDPHFARLSEVTRLRVAVQIQGGMSVAELFAQADSQLQAAPVSERAWLDRSGGVGRPAGSGKRGAMRTMLRMRVGSSGRSPVWATWPMIMHRPIPDGAVIKHAFVSVERIGPRESWYVCFTVDESSVKRRSTSGVGRVAVPVGWRVRAGGDLRVAVIVGDGDGDAPQEVILDSDWISSHKESDRLRGVRDEKFNAARASLIAWLTAREDLPSWIEDARRTLWSWRSAGRLASLARSWRLNRFPGDEDVFVALEAWRYKDHHLWEWETSQRTKTLLRRREHYRRLAADLSSRYGELLLADIDKRPLARRPGPTEDYENETARANRQLAAVSELEGALRNAFLRRGGRVTKVDVSSGGGTSGAGGTHECHVCGYPNEFDAAVSVEQWCSGCGARWDQDVNMAKNMLKRRERSGDEKEAGIARNDEKGSNGAEKREGRWAKAKRGKAEKALQTETARKADDDAAE